MERGRRKKRGKNKTQQSVQSRAASQSRSRQRQKSKSRDRNKTDSVAQRVKEAPSRRLLRSAAVAIKGFGEQILYAKTLKRLQEQIDLKNMGIATSKIRKAANGGILIQIPCADGATKADDLAAKLKVLRGEAEVSRPTVKGELRISGFDESVTADNIYDVVAEVGKCQRDKSWPDTQNAERPWLCMGAVPPHGCTTCVSTGEAEDSMDGCAG